MTYQTVLDFWFLEIKPEQYWTEDPVVDTEIRERFGVVHQMAVAGLLNNWRETAEGRLAEIIVLDQFSRNIYREDARAYAQDPQALALAQEAIRQKEDLKLSLPQRAFLYMPFMHSESAQIHLESLRVFSTPGLEQSYKAALQHKTIVDRFGRYPHRNEVLNRKSTKAEQKYLQEHVQLV